MIGRKLVAAHDPRAGDFPEVVEGLKEHGVVFYDTYEEMLGSGVKATTARASPSLTSTMTATLICT